MHAILANHYLFGASYPRGGASEIAFHIIPVIEKAGGKVLVRAMVSKILVDENSGRVRGKGSWFKIKMCLPSFVFFIIIAESAEGEGD